MERQQQIVWQNGGNKNKWKDKSYLFEAAVTELTMNVLDSGEGFLAGEGEYPLPGRLAVLAEGFAQNMDLGEVNERLKEEGFESLYARSL